MKNTSNKFKQNQYVKISYFYVDLDSVMAYNKGVLGTVLSGPHFIDNSQYWLIQFDDHQNWIPESVLRHVNVLEAIIIDLQNK